MSDTLLLTQQLIRCPSITPDDAGCQQILRARLQKLGFLFKDIFLEDTHNLFARYGTAEPCLLLVGHTDVVPPGNLDNWKHPPFSATIENDFLYGRGAADMKSGLAAMICACEDFLQKNADFNGSIAFLFTSDEEGSGKNGIKKALEHLTEELKKVTWCVVGEPSSEKETGDTIKIGRRGSLSGHLTIYGKQGHIAYPHLADNPIHRCLVALQQLISMQWENSEYFPATSLQISNIHAGLGVNNVTPEKVEVDFNIRFAANLTAKQIQQDVTALLDKYQLTYVIDWQLSGLPFLTTPGTLIDTAQQVIEQITNLHPKLSTSGGISDGRFIAPLGIDIIEIGVCNATIHQIDERVKVEEVELLKNIYCALFEKLLINLS